MTPFKLIRLVRTPSSEVYMAWQEAVRVGQIDLHFADGLVHATIIVEQELEREGIDALIAQLDEDVVSSYLPDFDREDFFVNVFLGQEIFSYSDTEEDDGEDE